MNRRLLLAAPAALLLSFPAFAQHQHGSAQASAGTPSIVVEKPWTRVTPEGARVAGGFMVLRNAGNEPDRLIGGSFPNAQRVEVHEMTTTLGIMRMRQVEGIVIPPGGTVELKPGGYHMMFMELDQPVRSGARLRGTLVFERAGAIDIDYEVAPVGARAPGAHGGAGH
jgi:copper(I)-binding protein